MNSNRKINQRIPDNIIINMNNLFEYNSPYINKNKTVILNIEIEENINNSNLVKDIFNDIEKYIFKTKEKEEKDKIIIDKDNKGKLIDDIENIIRKEINNIFKSSEHGKKGKVISICKKEFMKVISNYIKNWEQYKDEIDFRNKSQLFPLLKNWIMNGIFNISQNENYTKIKKRGIYKFFGYQKYN